MARQAAVRLWTWAACLGGAAAGPSIAHADGVVVAIQEAGSSGAWSSWQPGAGTSTGEAFVVRDNERSPISVGDTIHDDDLIVTRRGRLRLEVEGKGEVTIYDGTVLLLRDYGIEHVLGGLLIEVQDSFRVQYVRSEAQVEGTRFRVEGDALGRGYVEVEEGRVRVGNEDGAVPVDAGKLARIGSSGAPTVEPTPPELRHRADRRSFPFAIGPQVGIGRAEHLGLDAGVTEWRTDVLARWRLPGPFAVMGSGGLAANPETAHVPLALGMEAWKGPVGVGLVMEGLFGVEQTSATQTAMVVGGAAYASGNLSVPVSRRVSVESRALVGFSTGLQVAGSVGVSVKP